MSKRGFIDIVTAILCILIGLMLFYEEKFFPCESDMILWPFMFVFIVLLFFFFKRIGFEYPLVWMLFVLIIFLILSLNKSTQNALIDIRQYGGMIKPAVVYKKSFTRKSARTIYVRFLSISGERQTTFFCEKEDYKNITLGDTIFVIYSIRCHNNTLLYSLFPTQEEKKKCKNGCFLDNGELLSF